MIYKNGPSLTHVGDDYFYDHIIPNSLRFLAEKLLIMIRFFISDDSYSFGISGMAVLPKEPI